MPLIVTFLVHRETKFPLCTRRASVDSVVLTVAYRPMHSVTLIGLKSV
jgi:hypothetical protein